MIPVSEEGQRRSRWGFELRRDTSVWSGHITADAVYRDLKLRGGVRSQLQARAEGSLVAAIRRGQ